MQVEGNYEPSAIVGKCLVMIKKKYYIEGLGSLYHLYSLYICFPNKNNISTGSFQMSGYVVYKVGCPNDLP